MIKKLVIGIVSGAALLGMVAGHAAAADYDLNLYGASAQHKFWLNLAPDYLAAKGCDTINQYAYNGKHGMAVGENCDFPVAGDNITIRYSSRASYDGIQAVHDRATRSMCNALDNCASLVPTQVNLGASDVAATSFTQVTSGWENGNQDFPTGPFIDRPDATHPLPPASAGLLSWNPIIVPFGFLINNQATEYMCVRDDDVAMTANPHKSYEKEGASCVPDAVAGVTPTPRAASGPSSDCLGFYKCLDGVCNGGLNAGQACLEAQDCPDVALENTYCKEVPVQNVTQTMARNIFSERVNNWSDFGPEYPDCPIVRCMRHAGSGTHATFDLAVMQGIDMAGVSTPFSTWHYESSTDLTKCVTDTPCAIGYVDVDKLLGFDYDDMAAGALGAHMAKYNGVSATRRNIVYGLYEFWAAQWVFYNPLDFPAGSGMAQIRADMATFSSDEDNLTTAELGNAALFWAAQAEMKVSRAGDGQPILK